MQEAHQTEGRIIGIRQSLYGEILPGITKKMQRYTIYLFLHIAHHVSGCSSAHHQELTTVHTASCICQTFAAT